MKKNCEKYKLFRFFRWKVDKMNRKVYTKMEK